MRTLYIHPGWSKTGTSAIQKALSHNRDALQAKGVLYPQSVSWTDGSHHTFAWAFTQNTGVYSNSYSAKDVIGMVNDEMQETKTNSVLLSSELSPLYFNNPRFATWAKENFDKVELLFTVRRQSELIVSLYNQLVKDPNVKYKPSLYTLLINNLNWLNFKSEIDRWNVSVPKENIHLLVFSKSLVIDFLSVFGIHELDDIETKLSDINTSIPNEVLEVVKVHNMTTNDNQEYSRKRDDIIDLFKTHKPEMNQVLFHKSEQEALDRHFKNGNKHLAGQYLNRDELFSNKVYEPVKSVGWPMMRELLQAEGRL